MRNYVLMSKRRGALPGFGARLRSARLRAGMSEKELEFQCGVKRSTISTYEHDHVLPGTMTIIWLAKALGVTSDYLLGLEEK
jgi:transcriptional regulator with XRE-family HTH domain